MEQFSKLANTYFLVMALMQLIPGLGTAYGAFSTFFPVFCVVIISMIKDAFEDNKRRKSDNIENNVIV